jgi:hypothetical protein
VNLRSRCVGYAARGFPKAKKNCQVKREGWFAREAMLVIGCLPLCLWWSMPVRPLRALVATVPEYFGIRERGTGLSESSRSEYVAFAVWLIVGGC